MSTAAKNSFGSYDTKVIADFCKNDKVNEFIDGIY